MINGEDLTIREMVIRILDQFPETKENDMLLAVELYTRFYRLRSIYELKQLGIPRFESIRRTRQRIQAEGLYVRRRNV